MSSGEASFVHLLGNSDSQCLGAGSSALWPLFADGKDLLGMGNPLPLPWSVSLSGLGPHPVLSNPLSDRRRGWRGRAEGHSQGPLHEGSSQRSGLQPGWFRMNKPAGPAHRPASLWPTRWTGANCAGFLLPETRTVSLGARERHLPPHPLDSSLGLGPTGLDRTALHP